MKESWHIEVFLRTVVALCDPEATLCDLQCELHLWFTHGNNSICGSSERISSDTMLVNSILNELICIIRPWFMHITARHNSLLLAKVDVILPLCPFMVDRSCNKSQHMKLSKYRLEIEKVQFGSKWLPPGFSIFLMVGLVLCFDAAPTFGSRIESTPRLLPLPLSISSARACVFVMAFHTSVDIQWHQFY